eukprot:m.64749 g.64749  ORF g.64749 m.64749 type:complete len:65 (-) comp9729_c0_seq2:1029-1223(-)
MYVSFLAAWYLVTAEAHASQKQLPFPYWGSMLFTAESASLCGQGSRDPRHPFAEHFGACTAGVA